MKGCAHCASCDLLLDVHGNTLRENPPAYCEDIRDGVTIYFCRECTLAAYAFCETVWVTYPPIPQHA